MKNRLNSRQRRRNKCGFSGEGSHKWVKTTPVGVINREETTAEVSHKCAIRSMQSSGSFLGGYMMSKHQGSKPNRILRRYMGYKSEKSLLNGLL